MSLIQIEMNEQILQDRFPLAELESHKKQNGVLSVVAGSSMIVGAAAFNLLGASVMGTGYLYGVISPDILSPLAVLCPWAVYCENYQNRGEDAVLIGSGCDRRKDFDEILSEVLAGGKPVVLDAYGLKRYKDLQMAHQGKLIMTPHLGEFSYLTGIPVSEIKVDRQALAMEYAKVNQVILVLKDHQTIVTDGSRIYVNQTGNQALAKAGSGDVLSGMIGGLCARKEEPFMAAVMAVYLHGLASVRASEHLAISVVEPTDLIGEIKQILFELHK